MSELEVFRAWVRAEIKAARLENERVLSCEEVSSYELDAANDMADELWGQVQTMLCKWRDV